MKTFQLFRQIPLALTVLWMAQAGALAASEPPVRGLCISAPRASQLGGFVQFIETALAQAKVNTLVLRVDYNYQFESHPELREGNALSKEDVGALVSACKRHGIDVIPQINLLGHQSWHSSLGNLLRVYPQFDETPHVELPEDYKWPNEDGLYCKSYCPLHPEVHGVVFALVDEIVEAFEAKAFHAGMDEVFYLGDSKCPRCAGIPKAKLFADEVTRIRDHLKGKGARLWIWGDRLIDGETTGIGLWEASENDTWPAVDLIPKDVVICDWHYERAVPTAPYFAVKGFDVISCPWRKPEVAIQQLRDMRDWRRQSPDEMADRFRGVMQTVWSSSQAFINRYNNENGDDGREGGGDARSFKALAREWNPRKQLFDGETLAGWEGDSKWWRVEDGALTGGSSTEKVPHNFFLATEEFFHNFDLRLKIRLTGDSSTGFINSGVQIRSVRVPNSTEMKGYQVDAGEGWWGRLYDESRRNRVIAQAADLDAVNAAVKRGDWNEYRIQAEGPRIRSWINGVPALDYTETDPEIPMNGRIGIQIHSGGMAVVQVKEVTIEELPPTPDAPLWENSGGEP